MARGLPAEESVKEERRTVGDPGDRETLCLYWPVGTLIITGFEVPDLYAGFCAQRATSLKADRKDITDLKLILWESRPILASLSLR
jgi:hypothetical protein